MERKADKAVEESLDGIFESKAKRNTASNPYERQPVRSSSSNKTPPEVYQFDYSLTAEMQTDEDIDMKMNYLLKKNSNYFAMEMNQMDMGEDANMMMVIDQDRKAMFQFVDMQANKILMAQDLEMDSDSDDQDVIDNTEITKVPNKQILGYDCEGVQIENDEMRSTIYFTNKAPIGFTFFNDPEQSKNFSIPKEIQGLMKEDTLMLEMHMEDLKEGLEVTWKALSLDKTSRELNTNAYKKF
jgi:hypothetical protein